MTPLSYVYFTGLYNAHTFFRDVRHYHLGVGVWPWSMVLVVAPLPLSGGARQWPIPLGAMARAKSHTRCVLRGRVLNPTCSHSKDHARS